jgi:hypothetical protein
MDKLLIGLFLLLINFAAKSSDTQIPESSDTQIPVGSSLYKILQHPQEEMTLKRLKYRLSYPQLEKEPEFLFWLATRSFLLIPVDDHMSTKVKDYCAVAPNKINKKNRYGLTPLEMAINMYKYDNTNHDYVYLLMRHGADATRLLKKDEYDGYDHKQVEFAKYLIEYHRSIRKLWVESCSRIDAVNKRDTKR